MNAAYDRRFVAGAILVTLGLAFLAAEWFALTDAVVIGAIAAVLLVAYALTRAYGYLVAGMILAGAAVGTGVQDYGYDESGGLVAVFVGAGFLGIYVLDLAARHGSRWWPLIPGTILVLFGASVATAGTAAAELIERLWPLGLVLAGLVVLLGARRVPASGPTAEPRAAP